MWGASKCFDRMLRKGEKVNSQSSVRFMCDSPLTAWKSYFSLYVIAACNALFRSLNYQLTPRETRNMGFHVRRLACLYKMIGRSFGQWAPLLVISSCFPWKHTFYDQLHNGEGGVSIEVAPRVRWLACVSKREVTGGGTADYCVSLSECPLILGIRSFTWILFSPFGFTYKWHKTRPERGIYFDKSGEFLRLNSSSYM